MSASPNILGKRFGSLTVTKKLEMNNHREMEWLCLCDCGNEHISTTNRLKKGQTTCCHSCAMKKISISNRKHGMEPRKLFHAYTNMKTRCYNSNYFLYHRYGGRGIQVCDEWLHSFSNFRSWALDNGYSEELTLDRIDNDGDYTPTNCRWVTVREQSNNRHTNRILTLNGEKDTMANWARRTNLPYWVIQERLDRYGWSEEEALTHPYRRKK